jgi:hypothetical protein
MRAIQRHSAPQLPVTQENRTDTGVEKCDLDAHTRWLADERPRPGNSTSKSLAQMNKSPDVGKATKKR